MFSNISLSVKIRLVNNHLPCQMHVSSIHSVFFVKKIIKMQWSVLCLFLLEITATIALDLEIGDGCLNADGNVGICTVDVECPEAELQIQKHRYHNFIRCGFQGHSEVVCCPPAVRQPSQTPRNPVLLASNVPRKSVRACNRYYKNVSSIYYQIAGGRDANIEDFPFMAALGRYNMDTQTYTFDCGSSLISDRFLLTAAHCYQNNLKDEIKIARLGVTKLDRVIRKKSFSRDFDIKRVVVHRDYTKREELNDIALVELTKSVTFSDVMFPACLHVESTLPTNFRILGWGATNGEGTQKENLQKATVQHVPKSKCQEKYNKHSRIIRDFQTCAANDTQDTCPGDSGGPLLVKESERPQIVGITSYGEQHCATGFPSIYTKVEKYLDWIEENVWPNDI